MSSGLWPPMFHHFSKYGIYVLRFFKEFGWKYVIVDDRIPCKDAGEIVFGQCRQASELWVSIIEKAYAKLHNNYQALISGDIAQALADMTGLVADKVKIQEKTKTKEDCDKLWERLKKEKKRGTMMGCSSETDEAGYIDHYISGQDTGLMGGHAYSIIDVLELDILPNPKKKRKEGGYAKHRILKLRNPWGQGEWKLKWSEGVTEDSDERKFILKYKY